MRGAWQGGEELQQRVSAVSLTSDNRKDSASLWKVSSRTVRASLGGGGRARAHTQAQKQTHKQESIERSDILPASGHHNHSAPALHPPTLAPPPHLVTVCLIGRSCSRMEWFMVDGVSSSVSCCLHTNNTHVSTHTHFDIRGQKHPQHGLTDGKLS